MTDQKDKELIEEINNMKTELIKAEEKRRTYELIKYPLTKFKDIKEYEEHLDKIMIPIMLLKAELKGRQESRKEVQERIIKIIEEEFYKEFGNEILRDWLLKQIQGEK